MADGDGILSGLGKGLSEAASYALPMALGAALGGPMGAAAGLASGKGAEAQAGASVGKTAIDWLKLGLQEEQTKSTEELKKAQLQATEEDRRARMAETKSRQEDLEAYRGMSMGERADEFKQRLLQHKDDQAFMQDYHTSMLALDAQGKQIQAALAGSMEQSRRDQLEEKHEENMRSRIAGAEAHSERLANDAVKDRSMMESIFGKGANLTHDQAYDRAFVDSLKAQGIARSDLLDLGVDPGVVDKVYPPAPTSSLKAKGAGASSGLPSGPPPKSMWGKTGTIAGRRVRIDSMGGVHSL